MKRLHLICNAHLDPYWQWEWEEGAAEAISTFRTAADLCDEFGSFIFCHNEVILYQWIEEYEPELFTRIQELVKAGKWHIMGGWYLQPDCNMPSGESFVRQILLGKTYFMDKFGVEPTAAINFDPFGHTRGLVQIMKKSGYNAYLFCRPTQNDAPLPDDDFIWVGYDGSEISGHRATTFYNSPLGKAREKVQGWIGLYPEKEVGLMLWGVGNHGGGPSRQDLRILAEMMRDTTDREILHSTPEAYFTELRASFQPKRHEGGINPWAVGCYTSMARVKQKHRLLENELYMTEKMVSTAAIQGLMAYPAADIREACRDLCVAEFHDILPGSSIQPVEEAAFRLLDHGLEILSRLKARAFFSLCGGQPKAPDGQIPILVYNPHPFPVKSVFQCEFMLADQQWSDSFTIARVQRDGQPIPSQIEKEGSNLNLDWRKRVVFDAELAPSQVTRFNAVLEMVPSRPMPEITPARGRYEIKTEALHVVVNAVTGLVDKLAVNGVDYLRTGAFKPIVIRDNEDPWGMSVTSYTELEGVFTLASPETSAWMAGVRKPTLDAVRIIEDGPVRAVFEVSLVYNASYIIQTYRIPKQGTEIEIEVRVIWNEKDKMLKWVVPTVFTDARYLGQQAYGYEEAVSGGQETVAHKWVMAVSDKRGQAVSLINDGVYGSDITGGEIRMSLLRSAGYCAHPIGERDVTPQDRFTARIDQGERIYRFWWNAGPSQERMAVLDREALTHNEKPFALSFFPSGHGKAPLPGMTLSDESIQIAAFKEAEKSGGYVIRLFEPTGTPRETTLSIPALNMSVAVKLGAFELKSLLLEPGAKTLTEIDLIERKV